RLGVEVYERDVSIYVGKNEIECMWIGCKGGNVEGEEVNVENGYVDLSCGKRLVGGEMKCVDLERVGGVICRGQVGGERLG
uniref:hypothetical protein n=1 Tax=Bacillus sp. WP8 TaxID=756828 RepID=UPI00164361C4